MTFVRSSLLSPFCPVAPGSPALSSTAAKVPRGQRFDAMRPVRAARGGRWEDAFQAGAPPATPSAPIRAAGQGAAARQRSLGTESTAGAGPLRHRRVARSRCTAAAGDKT